MYMTKSLWQMLWLQTLIDWAYVIKKCNYLVMVILLYNFSHDCRLKVAYLLACWNWIRIIKYFLEIKTLTILIITLDWTHQNCTMIGSKTLTHFQITYHFSMYLQLSDPSLLLKYPFLISCYPLISLGTLHCDNEPVLSLTYYITFIIFF